MECFENIVNRFQSLTFSENIPSQMFYSVPKTPLGTFIGQKTTMVWPLEKGGACLQQFGHVERREGSAYNGLIMWKEGRSVLRMVWSCRKEEHAYNGLVMQKEGKGVLTIVWSCRKKGGACLQWFGHIERTEERIYNGLVMQKEGRSMLTMVW